MDAATHLLVMAMVADRRLLLWIVKSIACQLRL
jgi:hypothetical protein